MMPTATTAVATTIATVVATTSSVNMRSHSAVRMDIIIASAPIGRSVLDGVGRLGPRRLRSCSEAERFQQSSEKKVGGCEKKSVVAV